MCPWPACLTVAWVEEGALAVRGLRVPGRGVVELACKGACVLGQPASQWLLQKQESKHQQCLKNETSDLHVLNVYSAR